MKNESIWLKDYDNKNIKKINKDINVDILIIGGGITGLSTAYHLKETNLKICIVEKNLIATGITSRTTGKLTFLQDNIYTKLKDKSKEYYESQKDAIKIVEDIITENNIKCDFKKVKSYIYATNDNNIKKIKKEQEMLDKLNIDYKTGTHLPFNIDCKYSLCIDNTAVFHPIKYLLELKKIILKNNIDIYEKSNVTSIIKESSQYICTVNDNKIIAKKVVIANHYPFFLYPYFMPLKTYIEKSYISVSKIDNIKEFSAITVSNPVKSMRFHTNNDKNYFIYLNGSHNLCTKYNDKNNFNTLINETQKINKTPDYIWSNQDLITEDYLPYIGFIDEGLLIGTGYNTWGMTNGSIAGKVLSDLLLNSENKYKSLFDPKRFKGFNSLKYPLYITYSAKSFIENKIIKNKYWYNDDIKFTKINGKNVAIYTDSNNKEHIVYNLCPHLKCSLIFNEIEKTWDCPCHGSRFDIDGNCIFGPSNKNICFYKK